jgi:SAM-dependent methyltransferase
MRTKHSFKRAAANRREFARQHLRGSLALDIGNIGRPEAGVIPLHRVASMPVVGVDLSLSNALITRHPRQVVAGVMQLPFRSAVFDSIYAGEVIEHLWSPFEALREMSRVLRPGGRVILDTPNPLSLDRLLRWMLLGFNTVGDSDHKILFLPAVLENLLDKAGFDIVALTTDAKVPVWRFDISAVARLPGGARIGSHLCVVADKRS